MPINRVQNHDAFICLIAAIALLVLMIAAQGYAGKDAGESIVAAGNDFVLTQKAVDTYGTFFAEQKLRWSQEEVARTALKYELLCREYRKNNNAQAGDQNTGNDSAAVATKIRDGNSYIQKVLDDHKISSAVIESYYRSNPEKFRTGEAPDGSIAVKPLDNGMKNEIRFKIIESKKEVIVKEFVDSLINKYDIKISNEKNFN